MSDEQIDRIIDALADTRKPMREALAARGILVCAECGDIDDGQRRGWTLQLDVDDELVAFCTDCDRKEFGDG